MGQFEKGARKDHGTGLVRDENGGREARKEKVVEMFLEFVVRRGSHHAFPLQGKFGRECIKKKKNTQITHSVLRQ